MSHLRKKACADKIGQKRLTELREQFKKHAQKNKQAKYERSDKGAATQAAYDKTDKGAARQAKYQDTDKGAARQVAYEKSEKGAARKKKAVQKAREEDYVGTKVAQNTWQATHRAKKCKANEERFTGQVLAAKRGKLETEEDRRLQFQEATLFGPDFACICCNKTRFRHNVKLYTDKVKASLEEKDMPEEIWLANPNVFTKIKLEGAGNQGAPVLQDVSRVCAGQVHLQDLSGQLLGQEEDPTVLCHEQSSAS